MAMFKSPTVMVGSPEYHELTGVKSDLIYLMMNFPTSCSLRCRKCALAGKGREMGETLSGEERVMIIKKAVEAGCRTMAVIGEGEPTENFGVMAEGINAAHEAGMTTIMFTTGIALDREQANFYCDHGVSLYISLDSLQPRVYQYLTGNGNLDRVLTNLTVLRAVYAAHPSQPIAGRRLVRLGINTTVSEKNITELPAIRAFANEDIQVVVNPPMRRGRLTGTKQWNRFVADNDEQERLTEAARMASDTGGHTSVANGVCSYFAHGVSVDVDGAFVTCGYAGETGAKLPNATAATADYFRAVNARIRATYTALTDYLGHAPSCPVRDGYDDLVRLL